MPPKKPMMLQLALSEQDYGYLRELAANRHSTMTAVLRDGIALQRRIDSIEDQQVKLPASGPNGVAHAIVQAADFLKLIR